MATEVTKNLGLNGDIFQALRNASMLISTGELVLTGLKKVTFLAVALVDFRVSSPILANSGFFRPIFGKCTN